MLVNIYLLLYLPMYLLTWVHEGVIVKPQQFCEQILNNKDYNVKKVIHIWLYYINRQKNTKQFFSFHLLNLQIDLF